MNTLAVMKGIAKNIATNGARPYTVTMNFLAHLHLASLANSSLLGNLMADFVRGNPWKSWPQSVAAGIALHRRVDTIADNLPEVRAISSSDAACCFDHTGCCLGPLSLPSLAASAPNGTSSRISVTCPSRTRAATFSNASGVSKP